MPSHRRLHLLPLAFVCGPLAAQEPPPDPAGKPAEQQVRTAPSKAEAACENDEGEPRHRHFRPLRFGHRVSFGAYLQGLMPVRELKQELDRRTGFGLGVQWSHDHGDWHASRTRLEWNTFPEGGPVAGTQTYAKNYTLSLDHLFKLNQGGSQAYLVAGIGGSRWYLEQSAAGLRNAQWTTKLAVAAGAGLRVADQVDLEVRYAASSINRTFDANSLQMSLGWRF